ncbi:MULTISPECIES: OmpW/AlkL family protein [Paraburkholderia]|uniref:OmpW family protein n=1 Tax=Paraburkholderia aromaticivorans TaxID=2026199 RepID=A0A248VY01_9BURK|nr:MULTISPECIES: OmpW family outer membrane protein [Paraburkholderia]ASW03909.1 OmpW family protein [Paraburkholderia aromaticivorans]PZR41820.1 MAG: OmpW family protein [Paraburkholderia fungorum]
MKRWSLGKWIVAAVAAAGATCAQADQGDVLARFRVLSIEPDVSTSGTLSTLNMGVNNSIVPEVDFTYMVTGNLGVELILGMTRHTVTSSLGGLGRVSLLPPTLTLAWHFNPQGKIRPYLGAGFNYTLFYNSSLQAGGTSVGVHNHSFGPALQAGIDVQVTKKIFVNADVKKLFIKTDATLDGAPIGTLKINPWVVGIGFGVKF